MSWKSIESEQKCNVEPKNKDAFHIITRKGGEAPYRARQAIRLDRAEDEIIDTYLHLFFFNEPSSQSTIYSSNEGEKLALTGVEG